MTISQAGFEVTVEEVRTLCGVFNPFPLLTPPSLLTSRSDSMDPDQPLPDLRIPRTPFLRARMLRDLPRRDITVPQYLRERRSVERECRSCSGEDEEAVGGGGV